MSDQSAFVNITGLSHHYSPQHKNHSPPALSDINLEIPKGACLGLLGPNGAGKSTLISILTGILKVQSGSISINNVPSDSGGKKLKSISAIAPQDLAFYPRLTIGENLAFFAGAYNLGKYTSQARTKFACEVCDLGDHLHKRSEALSGGMKRRLNLAIALLNQPEILYLDEPTVGIDARSRQTIIEAIRAMHKLGSTIIYTSHYMEEVEALCDHIAIIDQGRLIACNTMSAFLEIAGHQSLHLTLANPLPSNATPILLAKNAVFLSPTALFVEGLASGELNQFLALISELGGEIETIRYGKRKLEDVYLDILKLNEGK